MMMPGLGFSDPTERLLHERIPVQFFMLALVCHVLFWIGLGLRAEAFIDYFSGDWSALSVLHLLTAGVLLTVALGASMQMMPVALNQNAPKPLPCDVVFVSLLIGLVLLVLGFEQAWPQALAYGAGLLGLSVVAYIAIVGPIIARATLLKEARVFLATALLGLLLLAAAGGLTALNYTIPFLEEPLAMTRAHGVLGGLGVMGLLVFGFSQILVPMLVLARPTGTKLVYITYRAAAIAVGLGVWGAWAEEIYVIPLAVMSFGIAAIFHVETMRRILAKRMKDNLGTAFVLIRASWGGLLLVAMALVGALVFPDWERWPVLIGWLVLVGWLLTVLTGILQRVIPFLASMNSARGGGLPMTVSRLTHDGLFTAHMFLHLSAVILGAIAIIYAEPMLMIAASCAGAIAALAFLAAAMSTGMRLRQYRKQQQEKNQK